MKTTFEIPDAIFRQAKATASSHGLSLRRFFTDAIDEKLRGIHSPTGQRPWMKHYGALKKYARDLDRVDQIIQQEFEQINLADWK